jgi:uncharacterized protein (DUF362 family)
VSGLELKTNSVKAAFNVELRPSFKETAMFRFYSRRNLFQMAGAAAASMLGSRFALPQQPKPGAAGPNNMMRGFTITHPDPFPALETRATVSLVQGEDRRKMIYEALLAIDDQIKPKLKNKKSVVIKPNNVSTTLQLAATHADALRGIMDYITPRFKGPVYFAESSAGNTMEGFENFKYAAVAAEYKSHQVKLIDLNEEAQSPEQKPVILPLIDFDVHVVPVRLAARLFDPDAFIISAAILKTHNMAVATLSTKNMVLGAPLHQAPKENRRWNDKRRYHVGIRQSLYNYFLTAQKMQPYWGVAVIDGYEGMEGNGPSMGTPVPSRVAIASTDFIAADRVGAEAMGVDPNWLGWLKYCGEVGIGQWDISKIDVQGAKIAAIQKKYRLHSDIEKMLKWMGPMEEMPPNLGWIHPIGDTYPA